MSSYPRDSCKSYAIMNENEKNKCTTIDVSSLCYVKANTTHENQVHCAKLNQQHPHFVSHYVLYASMFSCRGDFGKSYVIVNKIKKKEYSTTHPSSFFFVKIIGTHENQIHCAKLNQQQPIFFLTT